MNRSEISELIERYAAGEASPHEAERLERLASANPDVARMVRAEAALRDAADVCLAGLETSRPSPSPQLMDMLRRTPPIVPDSGPASTFGFLGAATHWRALLLGALLLGIAIGWSLVGTAIDDSALQRDPRAPHATTVARPEHGAQPPAASAVSPNAEQGSSEAPAHIGSPGPSVAGRERSRISPVRAGANGSAPTPSTPAQSELAADTSARPLVLPKVALKTYESDSMNVRIEMKAER